MSKSPEFNWSSQKLKLLKLITLFLTTQLYNVITDVMFCQSDFKPQTPLTFQLLKWQNLNIDFSGVYILT